MIGVVWGFGCPLCREWDRPELIIPKIPPKILFSNSHSRTATAVISGAYFLKNEI
jgi:hypothetical protein